jgi:hypothetical protein
MLTGFDPLWCILLALLFTVLILVSVASDFLDALFPLFLLGFIVTATLGILGLVQLIFN